MKWLERILVNKDSRLPWLEVHSALNETDSSDAQSFTNKPDYARENPITHSLQEVVSIYSHSEGLENSSQMEEAIYSDELPEVKFENFIPISKLDELDLKSENSPANINISERQENDKEGPDDLSRHSFAPFKDNPETLTADITDQFVPTTPVANPDELVFQMETRQSTRNFLTMEMNLSGSTESFVARQPERIYPQTLKEPSKENTAAQPESPKVHAEPARHNDVLFGKKPDHDEIYLNEELPITPSEDLLLAPLTAVEYPDFAENGEEDDDFMALPEITRDGFLKPPSRQVENQGNKFTASPADTDQDLNEADKKHNFRCSVTPEISTSSQFHIPFNILHTGKDSYEHSDPAEVQHVIDKLESTLEQFGIEARVIGMQKGPIITRYEIRIPPGIKVNRILSLTDELAMALEALRVRIEAPIPGRSTVGIEIPNKKRSTVLLGDVLNHPDYNPSAVRLPLPLGKDIAGNNIIEDLTRMPHILIAGATGSGKSVAINSIITSMIISKSPEDVRMLMVDPKLVELSQYNDIPHLLHPVIADPQKAILGLNWAVEEMERRYEDMADMRARDIVSYNAKVELHNKKCRSIDDHMPKMPYIVILIDELGDLMMVAGKEVESSIIRLSQKARAIGIHLILATQRPSVDVITALIKANCPARIALQVAQKTDSRTILDSNGGEQLLGQGDMLFKHPSKAQLIRAQAPYVSDMEVETVVHTVKEMAKPAYILLEDPKSKSGELELEDEDLFEEAWQIIVESNKASASYLQRRLRIGYNRAARLIEAFEARGYIGPQVGSKPREIIGHH